MPLQIPLRLTLASNDVTVHRVPEPLYVSPPLYFPSRESECKLGLRYEYQHVIILQVLAFRLGYLPTIAEQALQVFQVHPYHLHSPACSLCTDMSDHLTICKQGVSIYLQLCVM